MQIEVYLGLGSNIGDKDLYLKQAIAAIEKLDQTKINNISSTYITKAWGNTEQAEFHNLVIKIKTSLEAPELLKKLQEIEMNMGRRFTEKWGPRIIDIDILLYGDKIIHTEELRVPHQYLKERLFVLVPLYEINKDLIFPDDGTHIQEVLITVLDREGEENIIKRL